MVVVSSYLTNINLLIDEYGDTFKVLSGVNLIVINKDQMPAYMETIGRRVPSGGR